MEPKYDSKIVEEKIMRFWEENAFFAFSPDSKKEVYSIDTPPPTVSGDIHMGHVFSYSQAEFVARYKRMKGFEVFYPFGLDNNGLPTELLIEKKIGKRAESMERERFTEIVRSEIEIYNKKYVELWKRLGLSVDWSLTYQTISSDVQKISQKSFLELNRMGRVYKKEAPVLYCPKCKTTVSQMELADKTLPSKMVFVKFDEGIVIATTRPELIPACVAIFVNPEDGKNKELIGRSVKVPIFGQEVKIIGDSRVDPNKGSGIVMCSTFGDQTDIEWYKAYGLDLKIIISPEGKITESSLKGLGIKEAREKVVGELREKELLLREEKIEHSVNTHERCDTEIEFIVKNQWYIHYLDLKDKFLELGSEIRWYPQHMKVRFDNWVSGLQWDWGISRQRYFGVYFPVWYCRKCNEVRFADEKALPVNPFVDKPAGRCEKCGSSDFEPESDVMDTWATSSLTPLINARWGLDGRYMDKIYPMSLRPQAHDIISFWAFTTVVKSYLHTNSIPWKDIIISGHGLDPKGEAMHKHLGNVIKPEGFIDKYGADPIRYWASSASLGEDSSFQEKELIACSKLINKMWNVARFMEMNCKSISKKSSENPVDRWILGRMNEAVSIATKRFDEYNYHGAKQAVEEFFWEFANDYLEFIKYRIYSGDESAYRPFMKSFLSVVKMLAPFIPFAMEEIYQTAFLSNNAFLEAFPEERSKSIHVSIWPSIEKVDAAQLEIGESIVSIIKFIRKWKHDNKMALNAELASITIDSEFDLGELRDIEGSMKIKKIERGKASLEVSNGIQIDITK